MIAIVGLDGATWDLAGPFMEAGDMPADELAATQYTLDELRAAVEEAEAAGTYVMAHAYNDRSVRNCIQSGVRSIEHGNLIDDETAQLIVRSGAYLVPTLVTYEALSEEGARYNVPENVVRKIDEARALGIRALRHAYEAGAKIASGSGTIAAGQTQNLKLKLKKAGRELLSDHDKPKVDAKVTYTDPAGAVVVTSAKVVLG